MTHRFSTVFLAYCTVATGLSQDIEFDSRRWQTDDITKQRELRVVIGNEERFDTVYTERLDGSGYDFRATHTPLSRYEYDCDGNLLRRIQIRQESRSDTSVVDQLDGTGLKQIIQTWIEDVPSGDYIEYYKHRKLRSSGHLDGFDDHGKPKKVGEWIEYDEAGNVISRKNYP